MPEAIDELRVYKLKKANKLNACANCKHAELQCPPVTRCKIHDDFRYLDTPACKDFEPIEKEED
jgi:hypothetical protein